MEPPGILGRFTSRSKGVRGRRYTLNNTKMTHSALIRWLPISARNGKRLPPTLRYVGLSRFAEDGEDWTDDSWSVEVKFDQPPPEQADDGVSEATVRFSFDSAPLARLKAGVRFALYEGTQMIASIDVLG